MTNGRAQDTMADAGWLKEDPEEKNTKFNAGDKDNTKETRRELTKRAAEYVEIPKEAPGRLIYCLHFLY